jgi:hypothetical protein
VRGGPPGRAWGKHGATLCLRTQVKCHKPICHNDLRSNSRISQAVFIRSHTQSQPAPLKPVLSNRHRQWPTAGPRLGVDTWFRLSPRTRVGRAVLPEGAHGGWASRHRCGAGMSGGGAWRAPGAGLGWGSVAGSGGAGADDHGQRRIAVTDGSRASQPSGAGVAPGPPAPALCRGGPDDRSATGLRGWCPGLLAGLAGGVSRHPSATLPGPPAGQRLNKLPLLRVPTR